LSFACSSSFSQYSGIKTLKLLDENSQLIGRQMVDAGSGFTSSATWERGAKLVGAGLIATIFID
jgi:hypothetical protein